VKIIDAIEAITYCPKSMTATHTPTDKPHDLTPERIMQMAWGFAPPLMLEVAIRHQVFDFVDGTAHTAEEVAGYAGGSVRGWRAVLNALVGLEFLRKEGERYITSPESSAFLVTTKPSFSGGLLRHTTTHLIPAWLHLDEIVKTGKPSKTINQSSQGETFFAEFVSDIFNMSYPSARLLAEHLSLGKCQSPIKVLDVAAGSGVWGIALAQSSTNVHVTAVDWPGVLPLTRQHAEKFGVSSRFDYLSGDILEVEYPTGFDVATLGHILHSDGEKRSRELLKKMYGALKPGGTIAIAEFTPNTERTGPPHTLIFAVNMLVNTEHGNTYPFVEVAGWLKDAGFIEAREIPCSGPAPLILATRK
jgi:2-polyprenyl-3-methyl-5-hydroxy-6-metoxy-1,4-benzoquinol methylase